MERKSKHIRRKSKPSAAPPQRAGKRRPTSSSASSPASGPIADSRPSVQHAQNAHKALRLGQELGVQDEEIRVQNRQLLESQRLVEESRDQYAELYDFAPVGYITMCRRGLIRNINLTGADLLGVMREELIDRPMLAMVAANYRRRWMDHLRHCAEGAFPVRSELVLRRRDGREIPVEMLTVPAPAATLQQTRYRTAMIDISDRWHAADEAQRRQEAAASADLLRTVLEGLAVGVQVLDADGNTLFCNRAALRLWGVHDGELGRYWEQPRAWQAGGGKALGRADWPIPRALFAGEPMCNQPLDILAYDQTCKTVYLSAIPLHEAPGRTRGAVVVMEDITAARAHERQLQQSKDAAENANRLKDQFLAIVSHELRTPLSSILLWTHLLKNGVENEQERQEAIRTIEEAAQSQSHLVNDLLDVSRIIVGKLNLELSEKGVTAVATAAVAAARGAAQAKHVHLELSATATTDTARIDPNRLQQVIANLLGNALKFTPPGGRIDVRVENDSHRLRILVADSGAGISPAFLPHVFDRFRQAEPALTRRHGGLGLGLTIARQLVELHGGIIRADSAGEGKGATFTIDLPLTGVPGATEPPRQAAQPQATDDNGHRPLCGLRVLLVEDEAPTRQALERILEQAGAAVTAVDGVPAAREALHATLPLDMPHVVLSDIAMPGEDGYTLIRELRATAPSSGPQRRLRDMPAVALTAHAREEDHRRAREAGFQAHLAKPVDAADLIQTLARVAAAK